MDCKQILISFLFLIKELHIIILPAECPNKGNDTATFLALKTLHYEDYAIIFQNNLTNFFVKDCIYQYLNSKLYSETVD